MNKKPPGWDLIGQPGRGVPHRLPDATYYGRRRPESTWITLDRLLCHGPELLPLPFTLTYLPYGFFIPGLISVYLLTEYRRAPELSQLGPLT